MISQGHLCVYDVTLSVRAPLFIGSGRRYNKKEYIFDPKARIVRIIDETKMLNLLIDLDLIDAYEHYILLQSQDRLYDFFKSWDISQKEIDSMTLYTADAADAIVPGSPLNEIWQFMRDARHMPYVPGSSIKGALRTAILWKLIADGEKLPLYMGSKGRDIEAQYLNLLHLHEQKDRLKPPDELNSIMRGVSVSDSLLIAQNDIILARKDDISVHGNKKSINLIREAIRPGVEIHMKLTLDTSVKGAPSADFIRQAVSEYGQYYYKTYLPVYKMPKNAEFERFENCLVLGGGSGYFGKNIVYPMLGNEKGLKHVSQIMKARYGNHKHEIDVDLGISPHRMKHTTYRERSYHFGVCQFRLE